jgi:putative transposase
MNARAHPQSGSLEQQPGSLQEEIWSQFRAVLKQELKGMIERTLEEELTQHLAARTHERTAERRGYRNGHYRRRLLTPQGEIPDLAVPRAEEGGLEFQTLGRYQRRQLEIDRILGQLFLAGISTRRLRQLSEELYGRRVSATTISKTTAHLAEELEQYRTAPIADEEVEFLFLDGISERVRELGVERKILLCALGQTGTGKKRIVGFRLVDAEDTASWKAMLLELKARGLLGKHLRLITVDGCPGLLAALKEIYPFQKVQRCIAHRLRNVVVKLKRHQRGPVMTECKAIFGAPSKSEAIRRFRVWSKRWQVEAERAVCCLEKDFYHLLHYYAFPPELWKKIRTTNVLERTFREYRRRTRPMQVFPNPESAERIYYGVTDYLNQNWAERSQ